MFGAHQGRTLTPARIFTALMLVNSLRMPLAFYPMVLNMTAMAFVSLRRIHFFLVEEEVAHAPALPAVNEVRSPTRSRLQHQTPP
jgi:hypothetical protein